jgi:hypothetical protein
MIAEGLWTVPPCGRLAPAHRAWTALRADHTAHSLGDDEVDLFSVIKWIRFRLSRCKPTGQSGSVFGDQMDPFSVDKNTRRGQKHNDHSVR